MKTEQLLLTMRSSLSSQLNWRTEPCLLWAVFTVEKKLFNPAQVALTKIPRNEGKIYQKKTDFLSSEEHLFTLGCCLTLPSSLEVVKVRFASWSVHLVLEGATFLNRSRRPECYCFSRHVLAMPSLSTRGIIICMHRSSRLWLLNRFSFGNTWVSLHISAAVK